MIAYWQSERLTKTGLAPVLGDVGQIVAHDGPDVVNSIARVAIVLQESVTVEDFGLGLELR